MKLHEFSPQEVSIIVAEDIDAIRHLVCATLQTAGYSVLPAANGPAAMQIAEAFGGPIDLLVTDLDMPGGGGLELAKTLLKVHPRVRVLFMSGAYEPSTTEIFGERANRLFLLKPFSREKLLQAVAEVLS